MDRPGTVEVGVTLTGDPLYWTVALGTVTTAAAGVIWSFTVPLAGAKLPLESEKDQASLL